MLLDLFLADSAVDRMQTTVGVLYIVFYFIIWSILFVEFFWVPHPDEGSERQNHISKTYSNHSDGFSPKTIPYPLIEK